MDLTGRALAHYRIVGELSRGGMGVVYRAVDTRLNREVALKVLPDEVVHDPERRRRFVQEAQAASALEHPHIAVIHEVDEADGLTYIAMELVRGEKMSDTLARHRLPVARALELGAEIAEGLARAHEKRIVHRDLKPANVMVTDEGHAKIIDFGIAKLLERDAGSPSEHTTGDTGRGVVLGTITYMSPEQAQGDTVDHRSDIFALGVLLHEMLTGQPPFQGRSAQAIAHGERAIASVPEAGQLSAWARQSMAGILLARSQASLALIQAEQAAVEARRTPGEAGSFFLTLAVVRAAAGRRPEAEEAIRALTAMTDPMAPVRDARYGQVARGLVVLALGDAGTAIAELERAQLSLPVGVYPILGGPHVDIWYGLAQAYLAVGRDADAATHFQRIVDAGMVRAQFPVEYVRSFYFLGVIHEKQGDAVEAREAYRRFVSYWKDGDLDRDRIADARRKIAGT